MWSNWVCTDPDCFQHIRKNGSIFEMVECVPIPLDSRFAVLCTKINMEDYSEKEKSEYISMYYSEEEAEELDEDLVAECVLEQNIIDSDNVVFVAGTFESAQKIITVIMEKKKNEND